ncbi:hypothetical protein M408DRAFT_163960 [Serendipita vermifera MAFF 305830]|uniref:Uncharacterized protein n=1 Tax=Serendipita vermifera MAFF 305830 TaxID=933852 RepID=A0A0C2XF29_SERVB|nr:hypothetical protein M408DRAFT_163960 [Serendipita vermifera MAFF 305830]
MKNGSKIAARASKARGPFADECTAHGHWPSAHRSTLTSPRWQPDYWARIFALVLRTSIVKLTIRKSHSLVPVLAVRMGIPLFNGT